MGRVSENRARCVRRAEAGISKWMNEWKKKNLGFKLCAEAEIFFRHPDDGLVQERHNSSALAVELCLSYTNPLI